MRLKAGILTLLILLLGAAPAAAWGPFAPGSPGLGDPFFPLAGNGGYDVKHYSLALDYDPAAKFLDGEATIVARATQNLSRFNLDLREFAITRLTVNGLRATFTREGQELVITPRLKLIRGFPFVVRVEYAGEPKPVIDPDGSTEGWVPTADGAFVVGEPQGSPSWFPVNDNPRDKATYDMALTVPKGNVALGNGVLLWRRTHGNETTWRWLERNPMASYLATATNGVFELDVERGPRGLPIYNAVDPALDSPELDALLAKQPQMIEFFTSIYGPYPFDAYGAIVDQGGVGYALESQTKPNYDGAPDESTVVHELAHQWLGNSVTLTVWPDIWLNEGFAAWSEWIWSERTGGPSAAEIFDDLYSTPATNTAFWTPPPGDPGGPERLFDGTIYNRGGMTLQALREKVGDEVFFRILRAWCDENHDGNVTTADFIALAERESGQQLDDFFQIWLFTPAKPETW